MLACTVDVAVQLLAIPRIAISRVDSARPTMFYLLAPRPAMSALPAHEMGGANVGEKLIYSPATHSRNSVANRIKTRIDSIIHILRAKIMPKRVAGLPITNEI